MRKVAKSAWLIMVNPKTKGDLKMITTISFKHFLDSNDDAGLWVFPVLFKNLKDLEHKMHRKDFSVVQDPIWDNEIMAEEESVGDVVGQKIVVHCDDVFEKRVMDVYRNSVNEAIWR